MFQIIRFGEKIERNDMTCFFFDFKKKNFRKMKIVPNDEFGEKIENNDTHFFGQLIF